MKKIIIKSGLALGDHLVMEMAINSLHRQYPKTYITAVDIPQKDLFHHHPMISKSFSGEVIEMHYPLVNKCNEISHSFATGYCDFLGNALKIPLQLQVNRPHVYLTRAEKEKYKDLGPYWVVVVGGKADFTAKHLSQGHMQKVVDHYIGKVNFVQPVKPDHIHYGLNNVKILSKMNIRDMLSLVYNCSGVICPVTAWHHLAGAFSKPCVLVSGAREPVSWVQNYLKQTIINTVGSLSCCAERACWKSRVIPLNDGKKQDESLCEKPIFFMDQWLPTCIAKIKPETIISMVDQYV